MNRHRLVNKETGKIMTEFDFNDYKAFAKIFSSSGGCKGLECNDCPLQGISTNGGIFECIRIFSESKLEAIKTEKPSRKVIELYLSFDSNGRVQVCTTEGYSINKFHRKRYNGNHAVYLKENRSKEVHCRIYADTFERVE